MYLFLSSFPVYTNLLCGYAYTLFVMDTMYTLKMIRADKSMQSVKEIQQRSKIVKLFVYMLMVLTFLVFLIDFSIEVGTVVNQLNRLVISINYSVAGVVVGYFSIYFTYEVRREFGDTFRRPRYRVSAALSILTLISDHGCPDNHLGLLCLSTWLLHLVSDT